MANASSKRIASANEQALKTLQLGLLIVNSATWILRYIFSLIFSNRKFIPGWKLSLLHIVSLITTVVVWRWFLTIGTPRVDSRGNVKAGDDLGGKGIIELAWDLIYMTWICTLGGAILGNWIWYLYLLIPGFGAYKLYTFAKPFLGMFLPGLFGPKQPRDHNAPNAAGGAGAEPTESKRQAKLKARMEKGDKRVQQVQMKR